MKLKSFGCSLIFGNDLKDVNTHLGEPYAPPSRYTWPSLLAQSLGYQYECHARPGSGNLRILEKILSATTQETESVAFVIAWTLIDRFDYTTDIDNRTHQYDVVGTNRWRTLMPVEDDVYSQFYYKNLHSQYRDKLSSLIYIKTAIDTLQQKNIKFIMTYHDELLFETDCHTNSAVLDLQQYVRPYMTLFENKTFIKFSRDRGYEISPTWHPLEQAHQAAFETIKSYNLL